MQFFSFLASLHTSLPVGFEYPPPFLASKEVSFELALIDNSAVCVFTERKGIHALTEHIIQTQLGHKQF